MVMNFFHRRRRINAHHNWGKLPGPGQQRVLLCSAGGRQTVAGHVQQGVQTGGGVHSAADQPGDQQ